MWTPDELDAQAWALLLNLAAQHRVTPLLYFAVQPILAQLPTTTQTMLQERIERLRTRTLWMVTEIKRLLEALSQRGIAAIPLKGVVLAQDIYGSLFAREARDIDLLVRDADVDAAKATLLEQGYHWLEESLSASEQRRYRRHKTHYTLHHEQRGIHLELHWGLLRAPDVADEGLSGWWERAQPRRLWGQNALRFAPEDELLALLLHGSKHGWSDLIWACDLAAWLHSIPNVDWDTLYQRARRCHLDHFVTLGVLMSQRLVGAAFPSAVERAATADGIAAALTDELCADFFGERGAPNELTLTMFRQQMRLRRHWGDQWAYVRYQLDTWQPSPRDQAFLPLPRRFYGLYKLLRPLRMMIQYGTSGLRRKH